MKQNWVPILLNKNQRFLKSERRSPQIEWEVQSRTKKDSKPRSNIPVDNICIKLNQPTKLVVGRHKTHSSPPPMELCQAPKVSLFLEQHGSTLFCSVCPAFPFTPEKNLKTYFRKHLTMFKSYVATLQRFKPRTPKRPLEVPISSLLSSYQ